MQLGRTVSQVEGQVYVLKQTRSEMGAVNQIQVDYAPPILDSARPGVTAAPQTLKLHLDLRPSSYQMTSAFDSERCRYSGEVRFEDGGHLVHLHEFDYEDAVEHCY